jgi:hydroxymethylpyrimidine pyrophosphatase-like HAD family hydrolase
LYIACLATDYDGTLAHDGTVDASTIEALQEFKRTGRKLILATGRELTDLARAFSRLNLFDRVVAENGAVLFNPATKKERALAPPPSDKLVAALKARGVAPLSVGRTVVATWEPNQEAALEAIRELGLELQIVFNKGAVMILPAGVNKATGLKAALDELGLSAHNVVAVGDAENDHAFMQSSAYAVAVSNALPAVKDDADLVTKGARGAGVAELLALIIEKDADAFGIKLKHGSVEIGRYQDGRPILIHPHAGALLIAGLSGGGKSTLTQAIFERIVAHAFQVCVIDPEGDYANSRLAVVVGDAKAPPRLGEALKVIEEPDRNLVINMLAISTEDRPGIFASFLATLVDLRARTGRPHWMLIDEAHHVLPAERDPSITALPTALPATVFVTVDPATLAPAALERVDDVFVVGTKIAETVQVFCRALGIAPPLLPLEHPERGQALLWRRGRGEPPQIVAIHPTAEKSERHTRKYAEGELGEDKSFFFRGPEAALNLRAQNLSIFMQIADGVDDATWLHHLKQHDYSRWISEAIKDEELADEVRAAEPLNDPSQSRRRVREAIERRYTAPATKASDPSSV